MAYCTKQNLLDRPDGERELIQLTDLDGLGVINDTVLNGAIADAAAEIDGYLTAYSLPLAVIPANLTRIACDITRYCLYGNQMIDPVMERYKAAIRYLEQVAKGTISLGPDVAGNVPPSSSGHIEFSSSPSVFSRDSLSSF